MQNLANIVAGIGIPGLLMAMAIEGASIPFPGILVILTLGYVLNITPAQIPVIAAEMSFVYCAASYIPYMIGFKLEGMIRKRYEKEIGTAQKWFNKYGECSVALLRPFAAGNYISYIAGMSKVRLMKYTLLTFIGIYPWCLFTLMIGHMSNGNAGYGVQFMQSNLVYVYIVAVLLAIFCIVRGIYQKQILPVKRKMK